MKKARQMKKLLIFLLSLILLPSCDVIEAPYLDEAYINSLPADEKCLLEASRTEPFPEAYTFEKKVLLEKMTGHQCGNCPTATKEALRLNQQYGDRLVFVAIHAGPLANFNPDASKYSSNYKTETGDEWYLNLNNRNAVPFGMVDRSLSGTNAGQWEAFVQQRLAESPRLGLRIFNCYEPDSAALGVVVDALFLEEMGPQTRLSVLLVEDDLTDWQKDYSVPRGASPDLADYVHHHVLRASLNGSWGQPFASESIPGNSRHTQSYALKIDPSWKVENCKIVALVHDFESKEVFQVEIEDVL
jgi:hypothetical protein